MNSNLEIQKLVLKSKKSNVIEDKITLLKQAIQIADASNIITKGFDLRMELMNVENTSSRCKESFPAFTWIIDAVDNNPDVFDENDIMWDYRWMIQAAKNDPNISLEQINNLIEDWKIRLIRNDFGTREYYNIKICMGLFLGNFSEVKELIELRNKEMSNMGLDQAEIHEETELYFNLGKIDKALLVGEPLFKLKINPEYVFPLYTYCDALMFLYGGDRKDKAEEFFLKAENILFQRKETSGIDKVGKMIHYLTHTGDMNKAWDYFERFSAWNINSEDRINFDFSSSILRLFKEKGTKKLKLNSCLPFYNNEGVYNIEDLYNYYYNEAKTLAERFDARNMNTFISDNLKKRNR